jgi:hypothetical protein
MASGGATSRPVLIPPATWVGGWHAPSRGTSVPLGRLVVPILATMLRIISPPTAILSYLLIAGYSLAGRSQAVVALFLCCMFNLTNHTLGGVPQAAALLRYLIYVCALGSVLVAGRSPRAVRQGFVLIPYTVLICLLIMVHSLVVSPLLDVSLLKIISFTIVVLTIFTGWSWMDLSERQFAEKIIFGGLMVAAVASIPVIPLGMGYMKNPGLFQGVMVHPQNFGPIMAVLSAYLAMQCLTLRPLPTWRIGMLLVSLLMVYLSRSRVALMSFIASMAIGLIAESCRGLMANFRRSPRVVASRVGLATLLLAMLLIGNWNKVTDFYEDFIQKGNEGVTNVADAYQQARGFLVERLLKNIAENPYSGIGFGVNSSEDEWNGIARDPIFGLPIMFTVEKGVMPLAVVEELGYPLAIIVFGWLLMLGARSTRGGIVPFTVFVAVILINLTESVLFSPGGMGMLVLLLVGWSATAPVGGPWLQPIAYPATAREAA